MKRGGKAMLMDLGGSLSWKKWKQNTETLMDWYVIHVMENHQKNFVLGIYNSGVSCIRPALSEIIMINSGLYTKKLLYLEVLVLPHPISISHMCSFNFQLIKIKI